MNYKYYTLKEIEQQPKLWLNTYSLIKNQKQNIEDFVKIALPDTNSEIIFTGAGSSFFIGEIVAAKIQENSGISTKAISTTEIVTHPELYISSEKNTLMISFARSGNSPESVAAINLANKISDKISHLIISCNRDGKLANMEFLNKKFVLLMPEAANDKSLAMTSSVSTMALAALLISQISKIDELAEQIRRMSQYGQYIISNYKKQFKDIAKLDIKRAVFLGSGPNLGTARESHLKLQELTDGKLICKFDSFLGFRHGPKVVVNEKTLLVYLFSNNPYVFQYEKDLVNSVGNNVKPLYTIGVSDSFKSELNLDLTIKLNHNFTELKEEYLAICNLIPGQLLGYYKSLDLGLSPDTPSISGAIHRVVQGVTIYPFEFEVFKKELN